MAIPGCGADEPPAPRAQTILGGAGMVTVTTAGTLVNHYTALTADAAAATTTLQVASSAALIAAPGDLLLVIQMQGATIDTTNTATYGLVTALGGAGLYELVTVASVDLVNNTVTITAGCGLRNSYAAVAHTQVIWVPQYQSLTVSGAGSITAPAWNGATGGVVAIQAQSADLDSPGALNVAGLGFRGGTVKQQTTLPVTGAPAIVSTVITAAAEKGEGIAGAQTDYDGLNGRYGIGAPANGGGGGAPHNSGGGGGANGNDGQTWTGAGVMNGAVPGSAAWALDPEDILNGNMLTNSSGGGRGGYSYSSVQLNPTTVPPGAAAWGGDHRQQHGGRGGRPVASAATSRLFLGGGGGAGESNNNAGTSGARGGGLVLVIADKINGANTGSVIADGAAALTTLTGGGLTGNDAPGGGGGGGTVALLPLTGAGSVSNLTLSAAGGAGGKQNIATNEAEGPGGGGGGGFIALPQAGVAGVTTVVSGGAGGTSTSNGVLQFPTNGATDGALGQIAKVATGTSPPACLSADLSITKIGPTPATPGQTISYTVTATNNGPNPATGATVTDTFAATLGGVTWTCAGAACPAPSGSGNLAAVLGALAAGQSAVFTITGTVSPSATGTLSNTATLSVPPGITDGNLANNSATTNALLAPSSDLSMALSHLPAGVAVGGAYSYRVTVANAGPSDAAMLTATLTLPAGVTFVSAAGAGWICGQAGQTVTCTLAALAAGMGAPVIQVSVRAPNTTGPASATATVSATTPDPNPLNNSATDSFNVVRCVGNGDCPAGATCNGANQCVLAPPVVVAPANNSSTTQTRPAISGTAAPGSLVTVTVDGMGVGTATADAAGNWTLTPATALSLGSHKVQATATVGSGPLAVTSGPSNLNTFFIVQCLMNGDCASATAPFCNTAGGSDTCVGCSGDAGSGGSFPCPAATPLCAATGACGKCGTNSDCVGHPGGAICNRATGACGNLCVIDADCVSTSWCSAGVCTPKTPNGQPLPQAAPINGQCTAPNGLRVCLSGACDLTNNTCGLTNGKSCGPPPANAVCQSAVCFAADTRCGEPNSQPCATAAVCRTGICFSSDKLCGLPNGQSCDSPAVCRTVCVAADNLCGLLNGSPCSAAAQCRSNVCNPDGKCGDPNGAPCSGALTCRSTVCTGGRCGPACAVDGDCPSGDFCNGGLCTPKRPNGGACSRAAQCLSAVCNADGKCGDPDGAPCASALTCRSGACKGGQCGATCSQDADCGSATWCEAGTATCKPAQPNSSPCTRATQCASAVCNADGKCGNPDGQPCATAAICRGGVCDASGTCRSGGCTADPQCGPVSWCDGATGTCKPDLANSAPCVRGAQCLSSVCESDGKCGEPNGNPCGSPLLCRSGVCNSTGVCGQCQSDSDCGSGTVCDTATSICVTADMGAPSDLAGTDATVQSDASAPTDASVSLDGSLPDGGGRFSFSGGGFCSMAPAPGGGWLLLALLLSAVALARRARSKERR